jgi:MOSC domain-containing protein YiiM
MTQTATLQSMQVGTPARYDTDGSSWETSFFRQPDPTPRWLFVTHLDGNEQADKNNHGSLVAAVLVYAASHYPRWQRELDRPEMGPGGFGENFTVDGFCEATTCIGDTYAIGDAQIQVTGPRYPCAKISRRWGIPTLTAQVAKTGRTGWYCRVVREGLVQSGLPVTLVDRPYPHWTVALTNDFGHFRNQDVATARLLAQCPLLDEWWQRLVVRRALGHEW